MGCDIHLHVEMLVDGKWEHYNHPLIDRNYDLFAKMAGVRGLAEPIVAPKGLPDNLSKPTKIDAEGWGNDGHTGSWLSAAEAALVEQWAEKNMPESKLPIFGDFFGDYLGDFVPNDGNVPACVEDARVVFWFDN